MFDSAGQSRVPGHQLKWQVRAKSPVVLIVAGQRKGDVEKVPAVKPSTRDKREGQAASPGRQSGAHQLDPQRCLQHSENRPQDQERGHADGGHESSSSQHGQIVQSKNAANDSEKLGLLLQSGDVRAKENEHPHGVRGDDRGESQRRQGKSQDLPARRRTGPGTVVSSKKTPAAIISDP